jgi:hypothetical protein
MASGIAKASDLSGQTIYRIDRDHEKAEAELATCRL